MDIRKISPYLSVSPQLRPADMAELARLGFKAIINNRPDGESDDQPTHAELAAEADRHGLAITHVPIVPGQLGDEQVHAFLHAQQLLTGPVLAFCRTGTRSTKLWALSQVGRLDVDAIIRTAAEAGYEIEDSREQLEQAATITLRTDVAQLPVTHRHPVTYDVVIVGGGSAGVATASSLLHRRGDLDIAVIEPRERHFYQPGFTLAGAGVFDRSQLSCRTADVMPDPVRWIRTAAAAFDTEHNEVVLEDGSRVAYRQLVVAPGIKLDWDGIEGLRDTLGENGVTSNYRYDLTSYTWQLVQELRTGRALFTQPPMPIKCAGAPQKAMYLSCDHWRRNKRLDDINVQFYNAGGVLFGVDDYVPALMSYVRTYGANLNFFHRLVAIDGPAKTAVFEVRREGEAATQKTVDFDMIHVCPPQTAPDFIRDSALADAAGWIDVSPDTLRHTRFENVFGLGDACSAPNAKTMAAARKQAPVVAENVIAALAGKAPEAVYDGYGSCPLTVERGKVVLAEFGYGGRLMPTFPKWLVNGKKPSRAAWFLKERVLPPVYYRLMLKGREWLAAPGAHVASRRG